MLCVCVCGGCSVGVVRCVLVGCVFWFYVLIFCVYCLSVVLVYLFEYFVLVLCSCR